MSSSPELPPEALLATLSAEAIERYAESYRRFIRTAAAHENGGGPPELMARAVYAALTAPRPKTRYPVGPTAKLLPWLARLLPARLLDKLRCKIFGYPNQFGLRE